MRAIARRGVGNASKGFVGQGINAALGLVTAIVFARMLGAEDFGRYCAAMALVAILFVVSTLGLHLVEIRFLPPLRDRGDREALAELASLLWTLRLGASILSAAVCGFWLVGSRIHFEGVLPLAIAGFALTRFCYQATRSLLLPLDRVGRFMAAEIAQSVALLVLFPVGYWISGLLGGFSFVIFVNVGLFTLLLREVRRLVPLRATALRWSRVREVWGHGLSSYLGMIVRILGFWLPVWIIGNWVGPREAGFLGLAVQILAMTSSLAYTAALSTFPILAELQSRGEEHRMFSWFGELIRAAIVFLVALAICWFLVGPEVVTWTFGAAFADSYRPIAWILVAAVPNVAALIANAVHFLRDRPALWAFNLIVATSILLGGLVLVLRWEDVASAAAGVYLVSGIAFWTTTTVTVFVSEGRTLELPRTSVAMLPLLVLWPLAAWDAGMIIRWTATPVLLTAYAIWVAIFGLVDIRVLGSMLWQPKGRDRSDSCQ